MGFHYTKLQAIAKRMYRTFFPVPKSPWTDGYVEDICAVALVPPQKLIAFFTSMLEKLKALKGDAVGDYLEFGVFNGNSMSSMYKASHAMACSTRFFGFDAFEGLPANAENEDDGVWKKGYYACSFDTMKTCLQGKGVNPDDIHWIKGWYTETLTQDLVETHKLANLGLVFIDCDTYSSSKAVLDFIAPLLKSPAIVCFDDWKLNDLDIKGMGEYRAFNEFMASNTQIHAEELRSYNRKSKTFLLTPRAYSSL